jgi:alkaline phosphatase D
VGDERPIRFAFASCQDFVEKYYNSYLPLLTDEALAQIDFVVHLGDIIY